MAIPVSQFIPLPTTPDNRKIVFYICNSICVMKQFLNDDANIITGSSAGKKICLQCRRPQFDSWVRKICWRRDRLPTPVFLGFPGGSDSKKPIYDVGDLGSIPGGEDPLEKGMAPHLSMLAWRIPWTTGSQRVRHN